MARSLSVRLAGENDRAVWEGLWRGWQSHMKGEVPAAATARSWQKIITADSGLDCLLALDGEAALGFAILSCTPFAWTGDDILFLQDMFIVPEERGRGVGSALLKGVYAHADAVGAPQVFWMVDEDDAELQDFYARRAVRSPYLRYLRRGWPW